MAQQAAADSDSMGNDPAYYRPKRLAGGDHCQLYENTTEGTPISPVFETIEALSNVSPNTATTAAGNGLGKPLTPSSGNVH